MTNPTDINPDDMTPELGDALDDLVAVISLMLDADPGHDLTTQIAEEFDLSIHDASIALAKLVGKAILPA